MSTRRPDASAFLSAYYLGGTVVFWALDVLVNAPVRVALSTPRARAAYYVGLFAIGAVCRWRPRWAPVAGIAESAINLTLIFIGLWLPIVALSDAVLAGQDPAAPHSVLRVLNAALSVAVLTYALKRNERALLRMAGGRR